MEVEIKDKYTRLRLRKSTKSTFFSCDRLGPKSLHSASPTCSTKYTRLRLRKSTKSTFFLLGSPGLKKVSSLSFMSSCRIFYIPSKIGTGAVVPHTT